MSVYSTVAVVLLLFVSPLLNAQHESCGFSIFHEKLIEAHPEYQHIFALQEEGLGTTDMYNRNAAENFVIPVIVHVLHRGEAVGTGSNIPDKQIHNAIEWLNKAFAGEDHFTTSSTNISFALAQTSPSCLSSKGIIRKNAKDICSGGDCFSSKGITYLNEEAVKGGSNWPSYQYLNIWVVPEINDNNGQHGIQGYAYLPGSPAEVDGVVVLSNALGYDPDGFENFNLKAYTAANGVLVHEVGHALGLFHSFEGDDGNRDGYSDRCPSENGCGLFNGDCVDDTPPHRRSSGDCDVSGINVCDGGYKGERFVHNFMDYSSQECQTEFTPLQISRMREMIRKNRPGWIGNDLHNKPAGEPVVPVCAPQSKYLNSNYQIGVISVDVGEWSHTSGTTFEDGGYYDYWCGKIPGEPGERKSITVVTGPHNKENVAVFLDKNSDGDFSDNGEKAFTSSRKKIHTGEVVIPADAQPGDVFPLRIISDFQAYTIKNGCYVPVLGQVEDYLLVIEDEEGVVVDDENENGADDGDSGEEEGTGEKDPEALAFQIDVKDYGLTVIVSWAHEVDPDIRRYEVEKSVNGAAFKKVKEKKYKSSSNGGYSFFEFEFSRGPLSYKVKKVFKDGAVEESNVVSIRNSSAFNRSVEFVLYPNPVRSGEGFQVQGKFLDSAYSGELADLSGKILKRFEISPDKTNKRISGTGLSTGRYHLRLKRADNLIVLPLIIID